ncbi:MAG: 1,4-dihydroxy-6-naphthoate synthase [Chitinophagaceae bacterium]|nr:1,4-dihydroxy-6-naphthoate synthase [Chitinophagaceae bacterium]
MSYGVLPLVLNNYKVLESGGALGKGVGPLLITNSELGSTNYEVQNKKYEVQSTKYEVRGTKYDNGANNKLQTPNEQQETRNSKQQTPNNKPQTTNEQNKIVAIPGENTTAHLLFSLAYPNAKNKVFMPFHEIEDFVLNNENALGVIIHENRFTYQEKGLYLVKDLGTYWEETFNLPIPLGAIVAHNRIQKEMSLLVDELIRESIDYAFKHYPFVSDYVKQHAQEMEEEVMRKHIDLYVNNFSLALGSAGKKSVLKLLEIYQQQHPTCQIISNEIFINN